MRPSASIAVGTLIAERPLYKTPQVQQLVESLRLLGEKWVARSAEGLLSPRDSTTQHHDQRSLRHCG